MSLAKIPAHGTLQDEQFVQIQGPDGLTTGFQYDAQQRALYFKESQVIFPSFHGATHVAEDPIPEATCDTRGLMAADDKCKLDALLQTRIGVLGFQGAGFPDDGGWLQGDIILAAGTEFISLERIGNVVRITVDSPVPLNCACEECQQIFWLQDETDVSAIRPPACGGKVPGVNAYGELKVYAFPESTIVDPNNPAATLNKKDQYPALIFKRYDDAITPGSAEFELILKRNATNKTQTDIGWAFTPGAAGVAQCVWFMGRDDDGNLIRFDLEPDATPGLLGSLLYKGHLLSKKMAVIVDYTSTVLSTNQYSVREWDVDSGKPLGDPFTAKNVWQYANPENPSSGTSPKTLLLDGSVDLLPIGTLVELWFFKVGEVSGEAIRRHYFSKKPTLNPNHIWTWVGQVQFGDTLSARDELQADDGSEDIDAAVAVSALRDFEKASWGLTGYEDPLYAFDLGITDATDSEGDLTSQHRAVIDTALPGLKVVTATDAPDNFSERPVCLWHRQNMCNALFRAEIGRPDSSAFTPYDIVLRSPIDEFGDRYMRVVGVGQTQSSHYIRVAGVHFHDLPPQGSVRVLSPSGNANEVFNYGRKAIFPTIFAGEVTGVTDPPEGTVNDQSVDTLVLIAADTNNVAYTGATGDIVELLHQEYDATVVRVEFSYDSETGLIETQFKVGTLDMSLPYEGDDADDDADDFVRGLAAGYAVSAVYSQDAPFTGVGTQPTSSPEGFVVYDGGTQVGGTQAEYWNTLEIMLRDNQIWIWWNRLLVSPSSTLSAALASPVDIDTPYFTVEADAARTFGKTGLRLWPGAKVRRVDVRTQITLFNEFIYGQLEVG